MSKYRHAVQFYGDDRSLLKTVGHFLGEGLAAGQPSVVIATQAHRAGVMDELSTRHIDVTEARRMGDLVLLDADEMLSLFMVDDGPDPRLFRRGIGGTIDQTLGGRRNVRVRAYGEMVDFLWKDGRVEAAIKLEVLWNALAMTYGFELLCGYSIGSFFEHSARVHEVCGLHTEIMPIDGRFHFKPDWVA